MCVICYKPKNIELPKKEELQNCFSINRDGSGYMFTFNNRVIIKKGFMSFENLYNELLRDYKQFNLKEKNLIVHFRIGTSGGINQQKTHPFPLTQNENFLNALRVKTNIAVCHNGVLSKYTYDKDLSDTQTFIRDFLNRILKYTNFSLNDSFINKIIENEIANDKLILLDKNDNVLRLGKWCESNESKCFYSNLTYKTSYYTSSTEETHYNYNFKNYYNYWDDFYENDYSYSFKEKKETPKKEAKTYSGFKEIDLSKVNCDLKLIDNDNIFIYAMNNNLEITYSVEKYKDIYAFYVNEKNHVFKYTYSNFKCYDLGFCDIYDNSKKKYITYNEL